MDFQDFDVHTLKMKNTVWGYLLARRKRYFDTTVICESAQKEGVDIYTTPTPRALENIQQLPEHLTQYYLDHMTRKNEYLLNTENLESDAGDKGKKC